MCDGVRGPGQSGGDSRVGTVGWGQSGGDSRRAFFRILEIKLPEFLGEAVQAHIHCSKQY